MATEIIGVIKKYLPIASGESAKGKWTKQEFILETQVQYPREVAITDFNDKANAIGFGEGALVKVQLDIQGKEYNGKWYNSVNAWKIEAHGDSAAPKQPVRTQPQPQTETKPNFAHDPNDNESNDLPF